MRAGRSPTSRPSTGRSQARWDTRQYASAKHAVIGLTKAAGIDYFMAVVRCDVVAPGYSDSEMVDPFVETMPEGVG
jgi:NAD(P)-dependent dehydrogenase (short-subunit alcohol dehydrogenase family)